MQKSFLITGATSGLGKALAIKIAREYGDSCKMIMISRSFNKELDSLRSDKIKYIPGIDLLDISPNDAVSKQIDAFFIEPFVLIHSAGDFWDHVPFLSVNTKRAKDMMDSHYGTLYNVLQSVLPIMVKKGGGKILTFSCNATVYNFPNMLPFTAAKAAVDATIKCIAHEYANRNIVANSIALSSLQTEQNKDSKPFGDYYNYLDLEEISQTVIEIADLSNNLANGNVINCYKYSDSYYNQGYFERIKQK
jgi:NADP-dependent 3-hydroxy acid dehydrogenase YdfG